MQGVDLRKVCIQYSTSKTQSGGEGGMGYGVSSLGIFGGQRTRADLGPHMGWRLIWSKYRVMIILILIKNAGYREKNSRIWLNTSLFLFFALQPKSYWKSRPQIGVDLFLVFKIKI